MFNLTELLFTAWILNSLLCIEFIYCAPTSNILMETKLYKRGGGGGDQNAVQNHFHHQSGQCIKRKAIDAPGHHDSKLHVRTGVDLNHSGSQHENHPTSPSQREKLERLKESIEPYNVVGSYYFN